VIDVGTEGSQELDAVPKELEKEGQIVITLLRPTGSKPKRMITQKDRWPENNALSPLP
jgi:hypothetical protein